MNNEYENNENLTPEEESFPAAEEFTEDAVVDTEDTQEGTEESFSEPAPFDVEFTSQEDDEIFRDKPKKKKKTGIVLAIIIVVIALILVISGLGHFASKLRGGHKSSDVKLGTSEYTLNESDTQAPESDIAKIAKLRMPSVVAITNRSVSDVLTFFGTYEQESTSSGSGIIIGQNDKELFIVTNYHVIANSTELSVVFSPVESELEAQSENGKSVFDNERIPSAAVKGYDAARDVAVIAVYIDEIPDDVLEKIEIAPIGDSTKLFPGDRVIAIGNSLGYGQSVTTGIISAVNRKIPMQSQDGREVVTNAFIQTDAAINQGNSGGALLDMAGNVIGINSAKIATTGVEGMGYAIPISDVKKIIETLMTQSARGIVDKEKQGYLGIMGSDVEDRETQLYGIPKGVYVSEVIKGLASDKAGMVKGCIITDFDGTKIASMAQLQERLRYYSKGETVSIKAQVPENGRYVEKEYKVTLGKKGEDVG